MFQANQAFSALQGLLADPLTGKSPLDGYGWVFGVVLAILVALVIVGGIQRIGKAASVVVPGMCGIYLLACGWVLIAHAGEIPSTMGLILSEAFSVKAGVGGLIGVLITGFRRAAFSNEAGVGSASIAHAAATTSEPVREGYVALLEPFIDTIIVCTMTGLTVVITGAYKLEGVEGVRMTSEAFGSVISWFPFVLTIAVMLFAFSTMISWSYYGERCFTLMFGQKYSLHYKLIFLIFVVMGSSISLDNVVTFSDLMVLGMSFPNILGAVLLSGKVRAALDKYNNTYLKG